MNAAQTVPFQGTKEQELRLQEVIRSLKGEKGSLLPIMQEAQKIYGYLPVEVQQMIADGIHVPLSKVYSIATFYAQFNLAPKGKYQISVCLGTACYVKGSSEILEKVEKRLGIKSGQCTPDRRYSIESCRCVGACGLAPVMVINKKVFGRLKPDDVDTILDLYDKN